MSDADEIWRSRFSAENTIYLHLARAAVTASHEDNLFTASSGDLREIGGKSLFQGRVRQLAKCQALQRRTRGDSGADTRACTVPGLWSRPRSGCWEHLCTQTSASGADPQHPGRADQQGRRGPWGQPDQRPEFSWDLRWAGGSGAHKTLRSTV